VNHLLHRLLQLTRFLYDLIDIRKGLPDVRCGCSGTRTTDRENEEDRDNEDTHAIPSLYIHEGHGTGVTKPPHRHPQAHCDSIHTTTCQRFGGFHFAGSKYPASGVSILYSFIRRQSVVRLILSVHCCY
jgi:hypothetical protein